MRIHLIYRRPLTWLLALLLALVQPTPLLAATPQGEVSQTWQMLDYLATDYAGAVKDGTVLSVPEYLEMQEFSTIAQQRIRALPAGPASAALNQDADALVAAIAARKSPAEVAHQAHALADALLKAYPIASSPEHTPDLVRGATLYQAQCAVCHGRTGHGDGPTGLALSPRPVDFTDSQRADQRSALSLYQVITQGVTGTPMAAYADRLSRSDRWALAYYVGSLAYEKDAAAGAPLWRDNPAVRADIADLKDLSQLRATQLAETTGIASARAIMGYLRQHPEAARRDTAGLALARERLAASLTAYRSNDRARAGALALSAYLDGVEPVEPRLDARDAALRARLEMSMAAYRTGVNNGVPLARAASLERHAEGLLLEADRLLSGSTGTAAGTFLGAFTILVREGLEALLIVVALLAFVRRAGHVEAARPIHMGWVLALLAGMLTWWAASSAVAISGASRELTEGLSSLFAAAVLLSVGLWMHRKSVGGRWQSYLREKMATALGRRSAWFLFALSFISVYREVFETILFFVALWSEHQHGWMLAGMAAGAIFLAGLAWGLLRSSRRLPIGSFFAASSALIAVLAVVLTGKGVAALQEAGWVGLNAAPAPHIELLGIYPSWQPLVLQMLVIAVLLLGFLLNLRRGKTAEQR